MANLPTRNQNPGDLKDPASGSFRTFATPQEGHAALLNDLTAKMTGTSTTGIGPSSSIVDFSKVYAPASDKNNPAQYAANLANKLGVSPDTQIGTLTNRIGDFANAISGNEGYQSSNGFNPQPYSHPSEGSVPIPTQKEVDTQPHQEKGLIDQLRQRALDASQALQKSTTGEINPLSGVIQTVGSGAGAVNDVVGAGLNLIPGFKQVTGAIGQGVGALANTGIGKQVIGAGQSFSEAHPEAASNIGAFGNILGAAGAFEGAGALKDALGEGVGKAIGKDVLSSTIEDISPEIKSGTVAGSKNVGRYGVQKSGLLGTISRIEDPEVREAAKIVEEAVPNFKKLSTFSEKMNAVDSGASSEAENLRGKLAAEDAARPLTREQSNSVWGTYKQDVLNTVTKDANFTGDAGAKALRMLNHVEESLFSDGEDITREKLLNARQELDSWVKSTKPKIFNAQASSDTSVALKKVRDGLNEALSKISPDEDVQTSLRTQTLLNRASDTLAQKADQEVGTNSFSRIIEKHPRVTRLLKRGTQVAAGGLISGMGIEGGKGLIDFLQGK